MHGFCTVGFFMGILCIGWNCLEMRGKFCIFASGQQSQTELRLYFGVSILQKFQQSGHRNGQDRRTICQ